MTRHCQPTLVVILVTGNTIVGRHSTSAKSIAWSSPSGDCRQRQPGHAHCRPSLQMSPK